MVRAVQATEGGARAVAAPAAGHEASSHRRAAFLGDLGVERRNSPEEEFFHCHWSPSFSRQGLWGRARGFDLRSGSGLLLVFMLQQHGTSLGTYWTPGRASHS